ncbi:MAG: hypothetical protein QOK43_2556 [Acidimicrobiaceae bacterium]|nr:hypothetical protein [Acidimicrobiaceae bacterium]
MAQPEYVPLDADDRVRATEQMPAPDRWVADRPADMHGSTRPAGKRFGTPGPDQGYALKLARTFVEGGRLRLADGEHAEDAVAGCLGVALKRASLYGRAPVVFDLEHAFAVFGFLDDAPAEVTAFRKPLFQGAAHHYWDQRGIVDRVPESTLRLSPADVRAALARDWRSLLAV